MSSLLEGEWAIAESQRGMTQNEVNCMPRRSALKNGHLPEIKGWALYQRVSELLLSPKEGWRRMKWKLYTEVQRPEKRASSWEEGLISLPECEWADTESQREWSVKWKLYADVQRPEKRESSWEEGLSSIPEGEWAVAESQRRMTQIMRRMTTRQMKEIGKESINIFFDAVYKKNFHSRLNTFKNSYKLLIMSRVSCSDEFFIKRLISSKKKKKMKGVISFIS